ncbi:LysR family transcriptional regulator [Hellea sp.]|jgi:DNA-binding transcriptional LysR family regulator|nr:LysR family transcriptional regulator [Hellea sp.]MBT5836314.1 LysR family transcriptional regulator [Hellea sp.]MDA8888599.1 LysR family transcriptional regulator [Hellea sp.]MDB4844650.1 LysR family transcriptional regulator [Hellea sp.]MDC1061740.1 LysR family transcriptional regulator [Hellea sp.]
MDSLDWDKVKTFHAAAETGSLTAASEILKISQSAVSRQISALEDSLNTPLFHRHARGLTLTEQGRILYNTAREMAHKVALAQASVIDSRNKPQGVLRVSAPTSLGANWLTSVLPEFIEAYPDIDVQLILEDEEHDLSAFDVDCALRPWPSTQGDVIQRKLGTISQSLYASHSYLAKFGAPTSAQDLDNHNIIAFGDLRPSRLHSANWVLTAGSEGSIRTPILCVNNLHGIMRAAEAGIGLAGIPDYMTALSRRLVRILPQIKGESFDVFFVYPSELRGSVRAKVFREFLMRVTRSWKY